MLLSVQSNLVGFLNFTMLDEKNHAYLTNFTGIYSNEINFIAKMKQKVSFCWEIEQHTVY